MLTAPPFHSRAFPPQLLGLNSAPVLIPAYDLFNHSRDARVTWTLEACCSAEAGDKDGGEDIVAIRSNPKRRNEDRDRDRDRDSSDEKSAARVTLTLHDSVAKGAQVLNSYGPKSNEELLASYGFANEGMEDDAVTLKLAEEQSVSSMRSPQRVAQQHYWRYKEPCPASLIDEVLARLEASGGHPLDDDAEESSGDGEFVHVAGPARQRLRTLMDRGQALEMIIELLEHKLAVFQAVQASIRGADPGAPRQDAVRPSVFRDVGVYRTGV